MDVFLGIPVLATDPLTNSTTSGLGFGRVGGGDGDGGSGGSGGSGALLFFKDGLRPTLASFSGCSAGHSLATG